MEGDEGTNFVPFLPKRRRVSFEGPGIIVNDQDLPSLRIPKFLRGAKV
jgi:hypothetical protein